jgi:hypothetical protein
MTVRRLTCIDGPCQGDSFSTTAQQLRIEVVENGRHRIAVYNVEHRYPPFDIDWFQKGWRHPWGNDLEPETVYWLQWVKYDDRAPLVSDHSRPTA